MMFELCMDRERLDSPSHPGMAGYLIGSRISPLDRVQTGGSV